MHDGDYTADVNEVSLSELIQIYPMIEAVTSNPNFLYWISSEWSGEVKLRDFYVPLLDMPEEKAVEVFDDFYDYVPYGKDGLHRITNISIAEVQTVHYIFDKPFDFSPYEPQPEKEYSLEELIEDLNRREVQIQKETEEAAEKMKLSFGPALAKIMKKSSFIETVRWTQYTPYFNDGDTCRFEVNYDYPDINGGDLYDHDCYNRTFSHHEEDLSAPYGKRAVYKPLEGFVQEEFDVYVEIKEFLGSIPENLMLITFGDHVEITVNIDGTVEIEEYDHD